MLSDLDGDKLAGIVFLTILAGSLLGSLARTGIGQNLRNAGVWVLLILGGIAAYGMWDDIRATVLPQQTVLTGGALELPQQADGHYYADALVNGVKLRFTIDTGATDIVLNQADAAAVGLNPSALAYVGTATTANGEVGIATVRLDTLVLGDITAERVRASVNEGALDTSLLGMSFLSRFSSIEIAGGKMILTP